MINRDLIRQKTVQIVYSCYEREDTDPEKAEKELLFSLAKSYELYHAMFSLMISINSLAVRAYESALNRSHRLHEKEPSRKFVDNRFMLQLEGNKQLREYNETNAFDWSNEEEFVRKIYNAVTESEFYQDYMASQESNYEEDRAIWRQIYRTLIVENDELDSLLEEMSLYWNDDKAIVDSFVLKTINRFAEENGDDQELMPEYKSDDDRFYAQRLVRQTLQGAAYYQTLISQTTRNWDIERVPVMDRVILQVGLAELTSFPSIPISVTINEYLDLAKMYSTPKSGKYVNATLDNIAKKLIAEKKLIKN